MKMKDISVIAFFENGTVYQLKVAEQTKSNIIKCIIEEEGSLKLFKNEVNFTETDTLVKK